MREKDKLMTRIMQVGFVLDDLVLYLDTHPGCAQGLGMFREYSALYRELVAAYEQGCGPLTASAGCADQCWVWAATPMPWEMEG